MGMFKNDVVPLDGSETLIRNGKATSYSILNFWQWAYSNLMHNMHRGKFAEYVVKCALEQGGITSNKEPVVGIEAYDLDGPIIPSKNRAARVEVKSSASVQMWDPKDSEKEFNPAFSIEPTVAPDEIGDYLDDTPRQRQGDVYVFAVYAAKQYEQNIMDLSLWQFYVVPTYRLEEDPGRCKQKRISLKVIKTLCTSLSFEELYNGIVDACASIPADFESKRFPRDKK